MSKKYTYYKVQDVNPEEMFARLELSSISLQRNGSCFGVSKRLVKATERVASQGRKPTKGHMKAGGIKPPFCPSGSMPRVRDDGREKCKPIIQRCASVVYG